MKPRRGGPQVRRDLDENRLTEGTGPANMHLRRPDAGKRPSEWWGSR